MVKGKDLENLILKGIKYIGMKDNEVSIDLLIKIRSFLFNKTYNWYKNKFKEAYDFDIGLTRNKKDIYYDSDGIKYYFDTDGYLTSCELFGSKTKFKLKLKSKLDFNIIKENNRNEYYIYYYINEIDHFFTNCINNYLLNKRCCFNKEKGIIYVKNQLDSLL